MSILIMFKRNLILIVALIVFGLSAINNKGFYHPDEHYQIVEFAEFKNGNNGRADMAWEYHAKIRPTIQPFIYYVLISGLRSVNITDPYTIAAIARLMIGLTSLVIITLFINATLHLIDKDRIIYYQLLSYFICFIPFISVRFSSESFSALSFLLGLILIYKPVTNKTYFLLGICLGFSFLFRFQSAFMSTGLLLWLVFINKCKIYDLAKTIMGMLLIINIGAMIDYWFYGVFTYTFINYFTANVVNDIASNYGTYPWYHYFQELFHTCSAPIAITLILSSIILWFFDARNVLTWVLIPFLFIHFITPHKELRFLFPIGNLYPLIIISSIQILSNFNLLNNYFIKGVAILLVIINAIGLLLNMFSPADEEGRIGITQYIHQKYSKENVVLYYINEINPYKPITPNQRFYLDRNVKQKELSAEALPLKASDTVVRLLVIQKKSIYENRKLLAPLKLHYLSSGVPLWTQCFKHLINFRDEGNSLELFEVQVTK